VALGRTGPLRAELERAFPERPFAVRLWDGSEVSSTTSGAPTFTLRSPRGLAHLLRAPGELGLVRAYVTGLLDVDDLEGAIAVVDEWQPPSVSPRTGIRLALGAARACGVVIPPRAPAIELRLRGPRHTPLRDRAAIAHHYDAGNEFFALFLDNSMTYSCAFFSRASEPTLEAAQEAKLELTCQKLALQPGERLLDVGCGWGSFAIHAAQRHGANVVGITLSEAQAHLARRRVAELGLADRVDIRHTDYRDLRGERFDAIASIGMVEHVGENQIDLYARQLAALLPTGGRLLNHGIAQLRHGDDNDAGPFSERYVFPDGEPLHFSRIQLALERAGFLVEHVESFGDDYAETLRHWSQRFDGRHAEAARLAGPERTRAWSLYLHAARRGFLTRFESIYQARCRRL
jgi:cyclopropane-fatty-acyl-phospholipid synthase